MSKEIVFKILLLGDSSVGKTSLILKYTEDYFQETYLSTVGIEYKTKTLDINGVEVTLEIWDTAGQERFRSLSKTFIKDADGIIFVYDITNKKSFEDLKIWIKECEDHAKKNYKKILVGNKVDLDNDREVTEESHNKICEKEKISGFYTSAKSGENVDKAYEELARLIVGNKDSKQLDKDYGREISVEIPEKKFTKIKNNNDVRRRNCC